jgi:hypothetical protein
VSAQPNRKQQRLARDVSKSEGVPYQTALAKIRAEAKVDRWIARRPPAEDISPAEFEAFVAELLRAGSPGLENYTVQAHEVIHGVDGDYDFDATVRFSVLGMDYLVLVEDKRHKHPIKREVVQVLHQKLQSVGAQKAVMIATAPFQRGAIDFAKTYGIALVMVSEGRFTFETRAATPKPVMSREEAREKYGIPTFVAVCPGPGDEPRSTSITTIDPDDSQRIQKLLFGVPIEAGPERSTKMPDPVTEAAEAWLTRFIDMYAGMDAGPGDPVHAVREKAREFLDAGPIEDDPFTISEQIAAALHGDSHAATLGDGWRKELERLR